MQKRLNLSWKTKNYSIVKSHTGETNFNGCQDPVLCDWLLPECQANDRTEGRHKDARGNRRARVAFISCTACNTTVATSAIFAVSLSFFTVFIRCTWHRHCIDTLYSVIRSLASVQWAILQVFVFICVQFCLWANSGFFRLLAKLYAAVALEAVNLNKREITSQPQPSFCNRTCLYSTNKQWFLCGLFSALLPHKHWVYQVLSMSF